MYESFLKKIGKDYNIDKLSKRDINLIFDNVFEVLRTADYSKTEETKDFLRVLNKNMLSIIYKNKEEIEKLYNSISIIVLSNYANIKLNEIKMNNEFDELLDNKEYMKIFNVLYDSNLTSTSIAKEIGKTPQNTSNMLSLLKKKNAIESRKATANNKNVYYYLTYDFMKKYEEYNRKNTFIFNYKLFDMEINKKVEFNFAKDNQFKKYLEDFVIKGDINYEM